MHALPGAADAVLALDAPRTLAGSYTLSEFTARARFSIGPFEVDSWMLPHFVPNAGLRLTAGRTVFAYTGDTGPSPDIAALARGADLLLAEATYPYEVPGHSAAYLSSAVQAGQHAARAGAGRLVLTHLWPGTDPAVARRAAATAYAGPNEVAQPELVIDLP